MPYLPLSKQTHAGKHWKPFENYGFARSVILAPMAAAELPKALLHFPLGFVQSAPEEGFSLVAVLGFEAGKNLFIDESGRWLGAYVPAAFRGYPFVLAQTPEGQSVLCIEEDSPCVCDPQTGEPFFTEAGEPSEKVKAVLDFLIQTGQSRQMALRACNALKAEELIEPWPITLQGAQGPVPVQGLFRISEGRLNALSGEALAKVRDEGGLFMAYAQLFSMQHLSLLGTLAQRAEKARHALPVTPSNDLDLSFLSRGDALNFSGL
jgi:hypothetical protein